MKQITSIECGFYTTNDDDEGFLQLILDPPTKRITTALFNLFCNDPIKPFSKSWEQYEAFSKPEEDEKQPTDGNSSYPITLSKNESTYESVVDALLSVTSTTIKKAIEAKDSDDEHECEQDNTATNPDPIKTIIQDVGPQRMTFTVRRVHKEGDTFAILADIQQEHQLNENCVLIFWNSYTSAEETQERSRAILSCVRAIMDCELSVDYESSVSGLSDSEVTPDDNTVYAGFEVTPVDNADEEGDEVFVQVKTRQLNTHYAQQPQQLPNMNVAAPKAQQTMVSHLCMMEDEVYANKVEKHSIGTQTEVQEEFLLVWDMEHLKPSDSVSQQHKNCILRFATSHSAYQKCKIKKEFLATLEAQGVKVSTAMGAIIYNVILNSNR
eukprot:5687_1